jgi:hypothetical protein
MQITTEPTRIARMMALDPFDPATESTRAVVHVAVSREQSTAGRPTDLGCVDWYLYPVNSKPRQTER